MRRLYNLDAQPIIVSHDQPAVQPGDGHDFTEEQIKAGVTGIWSEEDPRKGRDQDREFKRTRRKQSRRVPAITEPASPEKE